MNDKLNFLLTKYPNILRELDPATKGLWGKMNVQQMVEHMSDFIRHGNGKSPQKLMTPAENLPKMKEFLMSEKEFRPNTKNAMMGEEPQAIVNASVKDAIDILETEIKDLEKHFKNSPHATATNPFFGDLNFEEWVQLLYKHAVHHLKQFGAL